MNATAQSCAYCARAAGTVEPPALVCGVTGRPVAPASGCFRPFERAVGSDDDLSPVPAAADRREVAA